MASLIPTGIVHGRSMMLVTAPRSVVSTAVGRIRISVGLCPSIMKGHEGVRSDSTTEQIWATRFVWASTQRIGPSNVVSTRQAGVVASLLSPARLGRLAESEKYDVVNAYPLADYMTDLKRAVFHGNTPDAGRRGLQRVYVQRLEALIAPPIAPAAGPLAAGPPSGGGGVAATRFIPFVSAPVIALSDLPALARLQLREIEREARTAGLASAATTTRAHWRDIADRVTAILDPK